MAEKRSCSLLGCLFNPRLYGVIVGVLSLWAMIAAISASVYLLAKYDDIKDVPDSLKAYYRYATLDVILILISLIVVGIYLLGIYKANEHYLTPFIVLLVLDFLGYIASEVLARNSGHGGPDRWKKNLLEIFVFSCIFSIVSHLYRVFGRQRQLQEQRLAGYRSISSSQEHIAM
ncbi:hypothetical protein pipiens_001544 [Culex pipiens pipiens]|uniref:MARVEL domain-containing protein n=1 Tax=Culex pipiens pipiens TaxID=38569 RepID=A0ABD1CN33_CULPP